jgi:hypothetical protein
MDLRIFLPTDVLKSFDDKKLLEWANSIFKKCKSNKQFANNEIDTVKKIIGTTYLDVMFQKNKVLWFDAAFVQPHVSYCGLDYKGKPREDMIKFYKDMKNTGTITMIKEIVGGVKPEFLKSITELVLMKNTTRDISNVQCAGAMWFYSKRTRGSFSLLPLLDEKDFPTFLEKILGGKLALKTAAMFYTRNNKKHLQDILKCIKDKTQYIYINLNLAISADTLHASNVILDMTDPQSPKLISLESSAGGSEEEVWFEFILSSSLKKFAREQLHLQNVQYITFSDEGCPRFSIQEEQDTCAIWSLYLFYLYILNKDRKKIYSALQKLNVNQRHQIIAQFVFFVGDNFTGGGWKRSDPEFYPLFKYLGEVWSIK